MWYEKNVTGSTTTVTKHFYANGLQLAKMVASSVYYLHEDALGSVRLVATATVTIKFSSNYVPYGSNYAMVGTEVFMYTGKMYDSATGLYYLMARYYDPSTGRFVTEDSYSGSMADPLTMNRYIYARDNPERYTDPDGHMFVVETDGGQEIGGDYLYTPAVMETVTLADTERERNEYVTDISAMTTYQNRAFGGNNPYGGGLNNPLKGYQWNTFRWQNPYGTPTTSSDPIQSGNTCTASAEVCNVLNYDPTHTGNSPYLKIGEGSVIIVGGVILIFLAKSGNPSSPNQFPPTPPGTPGPFGIIFFGGSLVFSGSAQLGYAFGNYLGF